MKTESSQIGNTIGYMNTTQFLGAANDNLFKGLKIHIGDFR